MSSPIRTGYFRYTDIYYEWHKTIEDEAERSALKAFISNNALVAPENPLRAGDPRGTKLFMGTMNSTGQLRLLFSSAQVEYIRYWLKTMGFTKQLISLPSSEYLLTDGDLRHCATVFYKNPADLKKAMKTIDKNNKRLRGTDSTLIVFRHVFERVRSLWAAKVGTWIAMDFEAWEMDHDLLTEFGWRVIRWTNGGQDTDEGHWIVKERMQLRNGKYVPDNREHYCFGETQPMSKTMFQTRICDMVREALANGPLFLVFHDSSQDLKDLRKLGAPLEELTHVLPDNTPSQGAFLVDTSELFAALIGESGERKKLDRMCHLLKIPTQFTHNAGNDAHYTLEAMLEMASGNHLDIQREERWPNHTEKAEPGTTASLKVNFEPWEEDSDKELEGMLYRQVIDGKVVQRTPADFEFSDDDFD